MNKSLKTGIATAALLSWLAAPVQAQMFPATVNLGALNPGAATIVNGGPGYSTADILLK